MDRSFRSIHSLFIFIFLLRKERKRFATDLVEIITFAKYHISAQKPHLPYPWKKAP